MSSPHRRVQVDPEPRSHDLPPGPALPLHPARSAHLEYYHVQSTTCAETQNTAVGLAMAAMEALLSLSPRHTIRKADVSRQPPRALTSRAASLPTIAAPQHDTTAREACPKRHGWTRCNHGAVSARKKTTNSCSADLGNSLPTRRLMEMRSPFMTQTRTPTWPDRHWAEIQTQAIALPLGRAGRIPASHHSRVSETAELASTWCLVGAAAILRPILLARSMRRSRGADNRRGTCSRAGIGGHAPLDRRPAGTQVDLTTAMCPKRKPRGVSLHTLPLPRPGWHQVPVSVWIMR